MPIINHMQSSRRSALLALAAAGVLWGLTVPLSKLALGWLPPAWLTLARFLLAAPPLAIAGRRGLRDALRWPIAGVGAVGFGAVIGWVAFHNPAAAGQVLGAAAVLAWIALSTLPMGALAPVRRAVRRAGRPLAPLRRAVRTSWAS